MATIQWRPEVNALTTPLSYRIRFMPRNAANIEDIAADIALHHPNFNQADLVTILRAEDEAIMNRLLNGERVTKEGTFSWYLSFTGRLDSPEDPLPPLEESLHVHIRVSPPFIEAMRHSAQTERLPEEKKLPLISTAQDTLLSLNDVLNPEGVLLLTGENLFFDRTQPDTGGCMIEGTRNGTSTQSRFVRVEPGEILLIPEIPAQTNPWNNEYTVSVSTHYSEHGTLRTGTYARMLRTPLTVTGFSGGQETGMLTGRANSPYVSLIGGTVLGPTSLRIQVILDLRTDSLLFNLIDMSEEGASGPVVTVTANGTSTLSGFTGSLVSSLDIRVDNFSALKDMIRNTYNGRLVDVLKLDIEPA